METPRIGYGRVPLMSGSPDGSAESVNTFPLATATTSPLTELSSGDEMPELLNAIGTKAVCAGNASCDAIGDETYAALLAAASCGEAAAPVATFVTTADE
jgi:hypothetical protein